MTFPKQREAPFTKKISIKSTNNIKRTGKISTKSNQIT